MVVEKILRLFKKKHFFIQESKKATKTYHYDIAISFANEQRVYAKKLYEELKKYDFSVFYDEEELNSIDLTDELAEVFRKAKYIILISSKDYQEKDYTNHELRFIKENIFKNRYKNLFIIKFDNTILEAIPDKTIKYFDSNISAKSNVEEIIRIIKNDTKRKKLENNKLKKEKVLNIEEKIYLIFNYFGIKNDEIPLIFPQHITFEDILKKQLYKKIDIYLLKDISNLFQFPFRWFFEDNMNILNYERGFYKNVKDFGDLISNENQIIILTDYVPHMIPKHKENNIILLTKQPLLKIKYDKNTYKEIFSYKIYYDSCSWDYLKCRYNLKSLLIYLKDIKNKDISTYTTGYAIEGVVKKMYDLMKGEIGIKDFLNEKQIWYPDDYVYLQHAQAKESEELKEILNAIKSKSKWSWY